MPKTILITDSAQNKAHNFVIFRVDLIITQQKISHAIWKKSLMDQKSVDCFAYREGRDSQKNPFWSKNWNVSMRGQTNSLDSLEIPKFGRDRLIIKPQPRHG